jgi:hypothetical protein
MKISSLRNLRPGLYLYNDLVDKVGQQHGLSAAGVQELEGRVARAIVIRALRSRDPESTLPVGATDEETPLVTLDDFNDWLRSIGAGNLEIAASVVEQFQIEAVEPDIETPDKPAAAEPVKKLTTIERQDERLRVFRERGGQDPSETGGKWKGVTAVAAQLGIKRQTLAADLRAAFAREKQRNQWQEAITSLKRNRH